MNLEQWKEHTQAGVRKMMQTLGQVAPGLSYGALSAAAILPVVAATGQGDYAAIGAVYQLLGGVGGNLIANQLQGWKDRSEAEMAAELAAKATADPAWREALDDILDKLEALRVVQAILSEADKDDLVQSLRSELAQVGSRLTIEATVGDNNKMVAIGEHITQISEEHHHHYPPAASPGSTPATLRSRYLQRLRQRCHVLPLEAMGGEGGLGEGVTLDKVYVSLNTTASVELSAEEKEARKQKGREPRDDERRPVSALEAARQSKRLVLLGDPGSGKSTFVQQLAADVAAHSLVSERAAPLSGLSGWKPGLLPVLSLLRDLAPRLAKLELEGKSDTKRDEALIEALRTLWREDLVALKCADFADVLDEALLSGKVLLIFDGLDEAPQSGRRLIRSALHALLQHSPQIERIIVTCRVRSYVGEAELPGFERYTLAPFNREQIGSFVESWYRAQLALGRVRDEGERRAKTQDLQQAALDSDLRELAENPMLLTTMAIIHQQEIRLPPQRVQLYKLAVNVLLQRWQTSKGIAASPRLHELLRNELKLRECLERIGYESLRVRLSAEAAQSKSKQNKQKRAARGEDEIEDEGNQSGDLRRGELLTLLDEPRYLGDSGLSQEFLDYIDQRAGLLVGRGGAAEADGEIERLRRPQSYRFPHRTFQEYLAGCYLVSQRSIERAYQERAAEGDRWELAALLGGEELLYNRANRNQLLDLIYALCPQKKPKDKRSWRSLLWSAQLAAVVGRQTIHLDSEHLHGGGEYLRRLSDHLLAAIGAKSPLAPIDKAIAGRVLGKLGDPRRGVGVVETLTPPHPEGSRSPFRRGSRGLVDETTSSSPVWGRLGGGVVLPDLLWSELILAVPFLMGSDPTKDKLAQKDEQPQFTCTLITQPYRISRYPITVAQYRCFIEAGGYEQETYWTEAGWAWRTEKKIAGSANYGGVFELENHPQVGVSWYEAVAFCQWLAVACGQAIRLPMEAERERAARGLDGRIYPWSDEWDEKKCNNAYLNLGGTTAVGIFPNGDSPCGAADMSGNVWEWCSKKWTANYQDYERQCDDILEGSERRLLRGGSFDNFESSVRCAFRLNLDPVGRDWFLGFRVVLPGSGNSDL